ncbi:MAG TPA: DMT family transporter [Pseudolabrys sp.]|nr:DMT family transporter [Pseudolabrys sp.]
MDNIVFLAVLFAAACHASWNALIKIGLDPLATTTLISLGAAVFALAAVPFFPVPATSAWPYLIASGFIHLVYFASLAEAYRAGDLGQVYPIARGSAPLMTATAGTLVVGEHLSFLAWAGIAALAAGVLLLSLRGGRDLAKLDRRAVGFALLTAVTICVYTVVDGVGARLSGNSISYVLWGFIAICVTLVPYALVRNGLALFADFGRLWPRGLAGGAMQVVSYGIALWAMTLAPIAIIASLRETSVLFGAIIAVIVLKEPPRAARIAAAILIVCGLVLIRVQ